MSSGDSRTAIVTSAVIVGGIYTYRRLIEPSSSRRASAGTSTPNVSSVPLSQPVAAAAQLAGSGAPPPLGRFIVGWGVTYLGLAAMESSGADALASAFAWLVAVGAFLVNGSQLAADLTDALSGVSGVSGASAASADTSATVTASDTWTPAPTLVGSSSTTPAAYPTHSTHRTPALNGA